MNPLFFDVSTRPKGLRFDSIGVDGPSFSVDARDATIEIFDAIGDGGVTPGRISAALREIGNQRVTVKINSPGGDYFAGGAIYNMLRAHAAGVTAQVLGVAASAASIIAMGAGRIEIARNASVMVHRAWALTIGNAADLEEAAKWLAGFDATAAKIYANRTGQNVTDVMQLMSAETWLDAERALDLGFADALLDRDADEPKRAVKAEAPTNKIQLEAELRARLGFSKAQAARLAAGGWPAMSREPDLNDALLQIELRKRDLADLIRKGTR